MGLEGVQKPNKCDKPDVRSLSLDCKFLDGWGQNHLCIPFSIRNDVLYVQMDKWVDKQAVNKQLYVTEIKSFNRILGIFGKPTSRLLKTGSGKGK